MPLIDKARQKLNDTGRQLRRFARSSSSRGFILILVVGSMAVLAVLGYSFIEQSRNDLSGAAHSRDANASDGMANYGFDIATRILADDTNVPSPSTGTPPGVKAVGGCGWTSRWGYNYNFNTLISATGGKVMPGIVNDLTGHGAQPTGTPGTGQAFSRGAGSPVGPSAFLDSWQMMIWNEQPLNALNPLSNGNAACAYIYQWDTAAQNNNTNPYPATTAYIQRKPTDLRDIVDTWPNQPLARVKTFLAHMGQTYGTVQVSITANDGAINVNGMFDPGSCYERAGYHDHLPPFNVALDPTPKAVDRRTLEYVLGRRPEWAYGHREFKSYDAPGSQARPGTPYPTNSYFIPSFNYDKLQFVASQPGGSCYLDNGVYCFPSFFEPNGRQTTQYVAAADAIPAVPPTPATPGLDGIWGTPDDTPFIPGTPAIAAIPLLGLQPPQGYKWPAFAGFGRNEYTNQADPMLIFNSHATAPNRYNYEGCRYPLWVCTAPPSMMADWGSGTGSIPNVVQNFQWYPTGRFVASAFWFKGTDPVGSGAQFGQPDLLFHGFGFDRLVPQRAGVGAALGDMYTLNDFDAVGAPTTYNGAGMYGCPQAHSFQRHFINAVAQGRFWTDLQANWYFGGSPGYTNRLGRSPDDQWLGQWANLGSSYDSLGIGTNWMPPTSHVQIPGAANVWNNGAVTGWETTCGLPMHPRNMPVAKPAATYVNPISPGSDDFGMPSPHWKWSAQRHMVRAFGMLENWGPPGSNNADGRYFDAPNINVAPYEVVYGLMNPEKIPSMMNRTVVAPHLHWKARQLDAAYKNMEKYERYTLVNYAGPGPYTVDPAKLNNYKIHAAAPYYPDKEFAASDEVPPLPLDGNLEAPLGGKLPKATAVEDPYGYMDTSGNFVKPYDVTNPTDSYIGPAPWNCSVHRAYLPIPRDSNYGRYFPSNALDIDNGKMSVLGKMDYINPEPISYLDLNSTDKVRVGTGEPQDDVFVNVHYDLSLSPSSTTIYDKLDKTTLPNKVNSRTVCPPWYHNSDHADWFLQRFTNIHDDYADADPGGAGNPLSWMGGNIPILPPFTPDPSYMGDAQGRTPFDMGGNKRKVIGTARVRDQPTPKTHPQYGLPNPDYMLLYPQVGNSAHWFPNWCDQFRRYFPVTARPAKMQPGPDGLPGTADDTPTPPIDVTTAGIIPAGLVAPDYNGMPCAPPPFRRMFDLLWNPAGFGGAPPNPSHADTYVQPLLPTPKGALQAGGVVAFPAHALFVPGISKDDAWRITRVGRKYQEIIADAIMDYQVNPWWPNPCVQFTEANVPLDAFYCKATDLRAVGNVTNLLNTINDKAKIGATQGLDNRPWLSFDHVVNVVKDPTISLQIPDYYAYYNRFWCRAAQTYTRDVPDGPFGSDCRAGAPYNNVSNYTEARGIYPQTKQYFGQYFSNPDLTGTQPGFANNSLNACYKDQIVDFPENTLEDQTGSDWRYLTSVQRPMYENAAKVAKPGTPLFTPMAAQYSAAPARNHPFKNWADFVAMLGHLVYRSPIEVSCPSRGVGTWWSGGATNRTDRIKAGIRDSVLGVSAFMVCHGPNADPKNVPTFFDGSKISTGLTAAADPDALQGFYLYDGAGGITPGPLRKPGEAIVAVDGFWPISGNYGAFPDPTGVAATPDDLMYPPPLIARWTALGGSKAECMRRIDEWRGRDAAGLRIEHHYISEAAANDILVSFSNGQIGPIDFDGDGHTTMTRKADIPLRDDLTPARDYWPGFPYHPYFGATKVEYRDMANTNVTNLNYGVVDSSCTWKKAKREEIIQNCVTLPIKFRSNTFRVSVSVQLTDEKYRPLGSIHRYSRVYSRVPGQPKGKAVHGDYTGEWIMHGNRACDGVDPDMTWLGTDPAFNE